MALSVKIPPNVLPIDKSWAIRMLVLDLWHGRTSWLEDSPEWPEDVRQAVRAVRDWHQRDIIAVGESGTLLRCLRMISWKRRVPKQFELTGTLRHRQVTDDPALATRSQQALLKVDGGTSQWASTAALTGDQERLTNPPYHLALTYQAIAAWQVANQAPKRWELRPDMTIHRQATAWRNLRDSGSLAFQPQQPEDYSFARVFNLITLTEGKRRWPSLRHHESNRLTEVDQALQQYQAGQAVESLDHRVVQAIALRAAADNRSVSFQHPEVVSKTWPQFWDFLEAHGT